MIETICKVSVATFLEACTVAGYIQYKYSSKDPSFDFAYHGTGCPCELTIHIQDRFRVVSDLERSFDWLKKKGVGVEFLLVREADV